MSRVRRASTRILLLMLLALLGTSFAPGSVVAAPGAGAAPYELTDLGVLGGLDTRAYALSSTGFVVGLGDTSPGSWVSGFHAFRWAPTHPGATEGTILDLGALGRRHRSAATGVDAKGVTVGVSLPPRGGSIGFVFDGELWALPDLGGGMSSADDINNRGQVTGSARLPGGEDHAVLWLLRHGAGDEPTVVDLGLPPGRIGSAGSAVNARGQVAGSVADADYYGHAAVWTPDRPHGTRGTWLELGDLPGGDGTVARDINRFGVVVGQGTTPRGDRGWVHDGSMRILRPLPGGMNSHAFGINDRGEIVGYSDTADGSGDLAVLFQGRRAMDLNIFLPAWAREAGYVLRAAHGINNRGQIVGVASIDGHAHGFLLTPTG